MQLYNFSTDDDREERHRQMIQLGCRIRKLRIQGGLTQERLAELANTSPKYLGEIERGIKNPTVVLIKRLATALGVPICELLSEDYCPLRGGLIQR